MKYAAVINIGNIREITRVDTCFFDLIFHISFGMLVLVLVQQRHDLFGGVAKNSAGSPQGTMQYHTTQPADAGKSPLDYL